MEVHACNVQAAIWMGFSCLLITLTLENSGLSRILSEETSSKNSEKKHEDYQQPFRHMLTREKETALLSRTKKNMARIENPKIEIG